MLNTRRSALAATLKTASALAATSLIPQVAGAAAPSGRLKQSVCKWCYPKISLDDLCRRGAAIGLKRYRPGRP